MNYKNTSVAILIAFLSFVAGYIAHTSHKHDKEHSKYDYCIQTDQQGYKVFSDGRYVGKMAWHEGNYFDELILADNE